MCEYIIKPKNEGKFLVKKITVAISYFLLLAILILLVITLTPLYVMIPLVLIAIAFVALVAAVSWRFVCPEYEMRIGNGDLIVTVIYGKSIRKTMINIPINSIGEIGEYDDAAYAEICKISLQKNYLCLSSLSAPNVYYALFDEEKDHCILYFDATDEAIKLLKTSNSGAFRASEKRIKK